MYFFRMKNNPMNTILFNPIHLFEFILMELCRLVKGKQSSNIKEKMMSKIIGTHIFAYICAGCSTRSAPPSNQTPKMHLPKKTRALRLGIPIFENSHVTTRSRNFQKLAHLCMPLAQRSTV